MKGISGNEEQRSLDAKLKSKGKEVRYQKRYAYKEKVHTQNHKNTHRLIEHSDTLFLSMSI